MESRDGTSALSAIEQWRKTRLEALVQERYAGSRPACAEALGYSGKSGYIGQLLYGIRPITEKAILKWRPVVGSWFDPPLDVERATQDLEPREEDLVPVESWVAAGDPSTTPGELDPDRERVACSHRHGPRTFALRVKGPSMQPEYLDGDIIFVDPDSQPEHGDFVVARFEEQRTATFKQLFVEDGRRVLQALNPDWKPRLTEMTGTVVIVGRVIGMSRKL